MTVKTPLENWLEGRKIKPGGKAQGSLIPGLDPETFRSVWNTGLDIAILAIRAGKAVRGAVNDAVNDIKARFAQADVERLRTAIGSQFADAVRLPEDETWKAGNKVNHDRAREDGRALQGAAPVNTDTGWPIQINKRGIEHTLYDARRPEHFQSVQALPELLRTAKLVNTEADALARQDIKAFHRFAARLQIGEREFPVKLTIRQTADGTKFYDHELMEDERPAAALSGRGDPGSPQLPAASQEQPSTVTPPGQVSSGQQKS